MIITNEKLALMSGVAINDNMRSVSVSLNQFGAKLGLDLQHRLAHYLAQLMHENGSFRYDREIASGAAYDGRKDLGNTEPGDGMRFKGRTGIQITGRSNYRQFTAWCRKMGFNAPDFEANPDAVNTDPWEGLAPLWYWTTRKLNDYADANDLEMIAKKINGGLNGYEDRIKRYVRAALVLNGYGPTDVLAFQTWAQQQGLLPADVPGKPSQRDGDAGPKTRAALHMALAKEKSAAPIPSPAPAVAPSPVVAETEVEVPVAVVAKGTEKSGSSWWVGLVGLAGTGATAFLESDFQTKLLLLGVVALAFVFFLWRGQSIAGRVKAIIKDIEG